MAFIYDLADVWADGATTFTAIKMDVTDTASASGSLLMDLQVGGASRFKVAKTGTTTFGNSAVIIDGPSGTITAASTISINSGAFRFLADTFLVRDAAGVLAQRNGTNAQTFNLYNTYTDASNYERGFFRYVSNTLEIGHEAAGTGSANRLIVIKGQSGTALDVVSGGTVAMRVGVGITAFTAAMGVGATAPSPDFNFVRRAAGIAAVASNIAGTAGAAVEFLEQTAPAAPAADRVRIYAEDDGAGKTRLMALFPTGAAQQIAIEP